MLSDPKCLCVVVVRMLWSGCVFCAMIGWCVGLPHETLDVVKGLVRLYGVAIDCRKEDCSVLI
jgi:hypothetical protein